MHEEPLTCASAWQASVEWCMQGGHSLWAIPRGHLEILVRTYPDLFRLQRSGNGADLSNVLTAKINDNDTL